MNTLKFIKLDFKISFSQLKILVIFFAVAIFFLIQGQDPFFIMNYLNFGILIISTVPFILEHTSLSGFMNLLPASTFSRIRGRFLYFFFLLCSLQLIGLIYCFALHRNLLDKQSLSLSLFSFSICILIGGIQYLTFYLLGNIKSQQLLSFIRVIPGFIFFFLINQLSVEEETDHINRFVSFFLEHIHLIALSFFAVSILLYILCAFISFFIYRRKDIC